MARRLTILAAATLLVAGSLTAQAYEHHLATSIAPPTQPGIPPHTCTLTKCTIDTPAPHVAGGWPYPTASAADHRWARMCNRCRVACSWRWQVKRTAGLSSRRPLASSARPEGRSDAPRTGIASATRANCAHLRMGRLRAMDAAWTTEPADLTRAVARRSRSGDSCWCR